MIFLKWFVAILVIIFIAGYFINASISAKIPSAKPSDSNKVIDYQFRNATPPKTSSALKTAEVWLRFFTEKKIDTTPDFDIPVNRLSRADLDHLSSDEIHVVKLGHSTILLKLMGEYWLLDPVFGERASPFSFMGPKRFHQPPISLEELPSIDRILISHNHYDHLDKASVKVLANKTKAFYVPLGVEADLESWGISADKITTFNWWDDIQTDQARIAFAPTQHFSGRGIGDGNKTLWGSWVITTPHSNLYFSGDSGYFDGFKIIGEKYGPFDLTLIETGAYDKDWPAIHMTPEQSVQAHIDLKGRTMVPIHNGTFDLAFHTWHDPFDRVSEETERLSVTLSTPVFGQVFQTKSDAIKNKWWLPTTR